MKIVNLIIIILSAAVLVGYVIFVDGFQNLVGVVRDARLRWLFCGMACMVLYWLFETFILHIAAKKVYRDQRFINTLKTCLIGQYFNCITPSATGGQPMQAYHMHKCGMPFGSASSALLVRFIIYQVVLALYSVVVLIFKYSSYIVKIEGFNLLVILGFIVNTVVVLFLLGVAFVPKLVAKFFHFLVKILVKIRIIKDKAEADERVDYEIEKFYSSLKELQCGFLTIIKMVLLTVLQLTVYFLIPFCVCLALGVFINPLEAIAASACVLMVSSFVPLPGAAGGAEGSFLVFFGMFLTDGSKTGTAILLWRLITFYLTIVIGMFFAQNMGKTKAVCSVQEQIKELEQGADKFE